MPLADNQKNVQFRFFQAGTSSWYWAFDNWGVYSVPSVVMPAPTLNVSLAGSTLAFTWSAPGSVSTAEDHEPGSGNLAKCGLCDHRRLGRGYHEWSASVLSLDRSVSR